ncbi:MAG: phospholipase D-like domain-containing protein, partial [Myxococcota bacterium]|nr:phospholipase D-like domain-containing protein [Myxococcota bacterium]
PQTILRDLPGDLSTSEAIGHIRALRARAHRGEALEKTDLFGFQKTTHDNTVELFTDRTYFTQELLPAIDRAEDSIHLAMLSFDGGELGQYTADKLIAKKRENPDLEVRLILDNVGSGALFPWQDASRNIERMRDAGIEVVVNHTLLNGMEHRKLLLVDGREAYFGGACLSDPYFGNDAYWAAYEQAVVESGDRKAVREAVFGRDTSVPFAVTREMELPEFHDFGLKFTGSTVNELQAGFLQSWIQHGNHVDPELSDGAFESRYFRGSETTRTDGNTSIKISHGIPKGESEYRQMVLEVVDEAKETLDINFTYILVPEFMEHVRKAADRGVKVRLLMPSEEGIDNIITWWASSSYYPDLMATGNVAIHEFKTYTHCKFMVADNRMVFTSTGNPELNSWESGYDEITLIDSPAFAAEVQREIFDKDMTPERSDIVVPAVFEKRSWFDKALEQLGLFLVWLFQRARAPKQPRRNLIEHTA